MTFTKKFLNNKDVVLCNFLRSSSCGHLFECIEYYYLFKTEYIPALGRSLRPAIYLAYDNFTKDDFREIIENKYNFSPIEVDSMLEDTFIETINYFMGYKIHDFRNTTTTIVVEGYDLIQMTRFNMFTLANNLIALRCAVAEKDYAEIVFNKCNFKVFQDYRVYGEDLQEKKTKNHIKKIFFNKLKLHKTREYNTALMYVSTDCRELTPSYIKEVLSQYPSFKKIYVAVLDTSPYEHLTTDRIEFVVPPMKSFHSKFDTMIYLPVGRKFDCSSRLIPECIYLGKKIIYHDIDYKDLGLEVRKEDSKSIMDLQLNRDDTLFKEVAQQCIRK